MSRNVYKCIRMSRQFQFFGTLFCVLPNSYSPSLMDSERTFWGHFAAFQLTAFAFKFSLGESSGFSVRAPRMSTMWARQGYFFDSGSLSRPCPNSMQLSWVRSIQVDVSRRDFFFLDFFLDFADVSSNRFRQPHEVCFTSLQLPWVRAGCDGLCRRVSFFFDPYMLEFADVCSPPSIGIGR